MSAKQGFRGIPGVPDGWELVAIRRVDKDEWYVSADGRVDRWKYSNQSDAAHPIIRKIETPKKYRAFANAEEFKPHRDRWMMHPNEPNKRFKPGDYNDSGVWGNDRRFYSYDELFESGTLFEDGTLLGVEVTE